MDVHHVVASLAHHELRQQHVALGVQRRDLQAERKLVALVKPQFEAGRKHVGKSGVVHDPAVQREVCERAAAWVAAQPGWAAVGIVESPILGPEGNREFLLYARRGG